MQQNADTFFQLTPLPHIILDLQGRILLINPACEKVLSQTISQMQNKELYRFIHKSYRQIFLYWLKSDQTFLSPLIVRLNLPSKPKFFVQLQGHKTTLRTIISLTPLSDELMTHSIQVNTEDQAETLLDRSDLQQLQITGALYESILAITSTLDLEEVLDKILENVSHAVKHDAADIMLIQDGVAFVARSRGYN